MCTLIWYTCVELMWNLCTLQYWANNLENRNFRHSALMLYKNFRSFFKKWFRFPSWPSSGPEFRVVWLWKMPASGQASLWESSSFVPWIAPNVFRDVFGAVPEWPWISGFMRKSSRRDNAPNMRFSVLLNSCDNFFLTLPSISSETWVT